MTPGQALHESLRQSALATFGTATPEFATWNEVPQWQRDRLEDAGKAAAEAGSRQLREQLAAMTARWKDQAAMHDRDAGRTGNGREAAALAAKSRVYTGAADEVLEMIGAGN